MGQPDFRTILDEIAASKRRIAEIAQSMHEMTMASDRIACDSRELLARAEQLLQRR